MPHQCTNCGRTFADGSKEMLSGCPDCGGKKFQFAPAGTASGSSAPGSGASSGDDDPDRGSSRGVTTRAAETVRGWVSSDSTDGSGSAATTPTAEAPSESATDRGSESPSERTSTETSAVAANESPAGTESDATEGTAEFSEWPETARRPEDRSNPPAASSSTESGPSDPTLEEDSPLGEQAPEPEQAPESQTPGEGQQAGDSDDLETEDTAQADARSAVVPSDDLPDQSAAPPAEPASPASAGEDQPPDHGRVVSEPSGQRPSIEELRAELNDQFESIKILEPGQYELNLMELYNRDEYIISLQEDGRYVIDVPDSWRDADAE